MKVSQEAFNERHNLMKLSIGIEIGAKINKEVYVVWYFVSIDVRALTHFRNFHKNYLIWLI